MAVMELSRVSMQTDTLAVVVLPELGGKIASLRWLPGNLELLQAPLADYAPRTMTMGFEEGDAGGWDECLPSVASCSLVTPRRVVRVPDHGDFWRLAWSCEQAGNEIRMAATGVSLPLRLERTLTFDDDALRIDYRVENVGDEPVEYAWSAHPLFAVDPEDRVLLPESVKAVRVEGSAGQRLGGKGMKHAWPRTKAKSGDVIDLSLAGGIGDGTGDKVFAAAPSEGWAAIIRRQRGVRIEVRFDPQRIPWLGLWLCYGGWPEGMARRQQCVAIEPCTAPMDSLAEAVEQGSARKLAAGEFDSWAMQVRVQAVAGS
jgi:galactose mutarotase-like enzyme